MVLSEVRSDGTSINYVYGDAGEKIEATVKSNLVYNGFKEIYSYSTDILGSTRWALGSGEP